MAIEALLRARREEILQIAARYGASNVRVFGSVARGEAGPESDIDLLVDFAPEASLFDLVGLKQDLEELLGCEVDLATESGLHRRIKARVLQEAVSL